MIGLYIQQKKKSARFFTDTLAIVSSLVKVHIYDFLSSKDQDSI